jgi:hypothetical protein
MLDGDGKGGINSERRAVGGVLNTKSTTDA